MGGNPNDSKWRSTSQADRKRKTVTFTLSDEARTRLDLLAGAHNTPRSKLVEDLIMAAKLPAGKK